MVITKQDKEILLRSLTTEKARINRAINAQTNQSIKEIMQADLVAVSDLSGRVFNEVAK